MKINKLGWLLLALMVCLISGCFNSGGGSNPVGNVSGTVVDMDSKGVADIYVTIGSTSTKTDSNGSYNFSGIPTGNYIISASGGSSGDELSHLAGGGAITVHSGDNALTPLQVYPMIGYGVVMRNASGGKSLAASPISMRIQEILAEGAIYQPGFGASHRNLSYGAKTATNEFLTGNDTLCYLHWKPITGISHYIIKYLNGSAETPVWDSATVDASEAFDVSKPKAYLNLGGELSGYINAAGIYLFGIEGVPSTGVNQKLPAITVSVGRYLGECPDLNTPDGGKLSWQSVTGTDGYIVGVFSDEQLKKNVYLSSSLQIETTCNVSSYLTSGNPYWWYVKANALDAAGWTTEVTTDTGTFDYK